ncbi:hypothetical protein LB567_14640 [Mesorhizobium sp. B264B1A]|nr:hypothetical protein [Mesorhizobium sp. B264B1B]MCA0019472.1 hypothetical protein [Mesorhizobium sp. B264B1A]MCA0024487.1 hypothetical protein [Mesorhizobium sp. B263B1A]MCA0055841.1 hypothetical protein [Mesorhizobium sp. B261B1A]TPI49308.1 hypothetical protein FJW11_25750 [Mesorhizobium sp. B3-1-1]TPJ41027.1 hypothetical protein FJ437_24930 [Mesorhizobium sp. B2-6-6]TPJ58984.1 hypothetical protein FJ443_25025 [Mesorhizobium sp. B2-6-1]TPJ63259.1 hypothetical protein FJ462_23960 [Mesorhi
MEGALASVGTSPKDVVVVHVFVPDRQDKEIVNRLVAEKFRGIHPANTTLCMPLGKPELKVEIEITAYRRRRPEEPENRLAVHLG